MSLCVCGSKKQYGDCCEPFHLAAAYPHSAEQLMRSRYSAFVLKLDDYVLKTWAKSTRPGTFSAEKDVVFTKLRIVKTQQGHAEDRKGVVKFKAFYEVNGEKGVMTETSEFIRDEDNRWVYLTGEVR